MTFLSELEPASYGRYGDWVPQADLERFVYLDEPARLWWRGCGVINRLGFSVQLTTARYTGVSVSIRCWHRAAA